jgi:prepilin-type processing-associated H-X9-DG protein
MIDWYHQSLGREDHMTYGTEACNLAWVDGHL